jgi:hypothetical protein
MYLAYDYKNSFFQFSYCNREETTESRGIYVFQSRSYYYRRGFFYFYLEIELKNHLHIPDARFYITNMIVNNFINCIFIFINYAVFLNNFLIKIYIKFSKKSLNILKYIFLFLFLLHFFIVGFYNENNFFAKKLLVPLSEWKEIVHQMPLSKQIELNQNSYFEGKIPNIKGIHDFQLISLGKNLKNNDVTDRYLAVPFKKIISLKNDDSVKFIESYATCIGKNSVNYSIFNITAKDRILIFKEEFSYSKKLRNHFIFVPNSHIFGFINKNSSKNICDYMILN